jgi:glucose-1-phosphate cytidylyltransferase
MKVVLFCGGFGTRLMDADNGLPKPMVRIGYRPIVWHLMKYYAHHGHKDFVLCLGYKGDVIKSYFLNYNETLSNDFVLADGGTRVDLLHRDIHDWRITFAETGLESSIGERLRRVRHYLDGEDYFLANYSDCLTDLDLNAWIAEFRGREKIAGFISVIPGSSQHYVKSDSTGMVERFTDVGRSGLRINGGFFVFRRAIFDYLEEGDDLVEAPFRRLIERRELVTHVHDGFWKAMDTSKDQQQFESMYTRGLRPWALWERSAP